MVKYCEEIFGDMLLKKLLDSCLVRLVFVNCNFCIYGIFVNCIF